MNEGDLFGYFASFLVFTTFYMKRMIPLLLTAIASNVAFITYAWLDHLTPIPILHGALLPLNLYRLVELRRLILKVLRASSNQFSIDALLPLMQRRSVGANDVLFKVNDPAEALYYVRPGAPFETCRRTLRMSAHRGRLEVIDHADDPKRKNAGAAF